MTEPPAWAPLPDDHRLRVSPASLCRADRLAVLAYMSGRLSSSPLRAERWLGSGLAAMLAGKDALDAFKIRPPRGSQRTLRHIEHWRRRDEALLRFAAAVGRDGLALQMLRGEIECPAEHRQLLAETLATGCAKSDRAISRARERRRFDGWTNCKA